MILGLMFILIFVLFMPFAFSIVERNLEVFLFIMGLLAVFITHKLNKDLIVLALKDPIFITIAVFAAGILFRTFQSQIERSVLKITKLISFPIFIALFVILLGLLSSMITAIIAAIVLVSITSLLRLDRKSELYLVVFACFAIGLGAVLTPVGEPLSTIATSKLNEDFFYLFNLLAPMIIPGVLAFGLLSAVFVKASSTKNQFNKGKPERESIAEIIVRSLKVYLFVMALTFLGAGFEPLINMYLIHLHPLTLYWINMISAILDNATLAAAEISPLMGEETIKAILMGLLISGGMLIPGNIPNIIAAGKLKISSTEWAKIGVPIGLITMSVYFIAFLI